jgi:hypothetical protein
MPCGCWALFACVSGDTLSQMQLRALILCPAFFAMAALAAASAAMSLSGRCDIVPHPDMVRDLCNAHALVARGTMPLHGTPSSLNSFNPPGVSFGLAAGMLFFPHNPALAERAGAQLLFAGTLLGLLLWLKPRLGRWAAVLAMLIYAAGSAGAFFQTSLWPRAHPFFYVWFLFALTLWIERRRSAWLGVALVLYAVGMYWFMEMAPAILLVPALYLLYRPPVSARSVLAALAASLAVWSPYLTFEAGRGFEDLRSLLLRKQMCSPVVADVVYDKDNHFVNTWDVPRLKAQGAAKPDGEWQDTLDWGVVWVDTTPRSYLGEWGLVFYTDKAGGWVFQSMETGRLLKKDAHNWEPGAYRFSFKTPYKVTLRRGESYVQRHLKHFGPLSNFGGDQAFPFWIWQTLLFSAALALAFYKSGIARAVLSACRAWLGAFRVGKRFAWAAHAVPQGPQATLAVLVLGALVPALVVAALVPGYVVLESERRYLWLWIAEAALIGAALGNARFRSVRIGVIACLAAVCTFAANPNTQGLFSNAFKGWPCGEKGARAEVLGSLAQVVHADGLDAARIGYDVDVNVWLAQLHAIEPESKCAQEWDAALLVAHGIRNLDTTAEGIGPDDDYRVVETRYTAGPMDRFHLRWSMASDGSLPAMEVVAQFPDYTIYRLAKGK